MEKRFTMLKGASVMLLAIMMGISCQKKVSAPVEENQLQKTSSSSNSSSEVSYEILNSGGKSIGHMIMKSTDGDLITVYMEALTSASKLTANIYEDNGAPVSSLNNLMKPRQEEMVGASPEEPQEFQMLSATTYPVVDYKSGNRITFKEMFSIKGRYLVLKNPEEKVVGKATF